MSIVQWESGCLAVIAGILLTLGSPAGAADPPTQYQRSELLPLLDALARGRGTAGPPLPAQLSPTAVDPRAVEVGRMLAELGLSVSPPIAQVMAAPATVPRAVLVGPGGDPVEVHRRTENATVRHLRGGILRKSLGGPALMDPRQASEATAWAFLRENHALFGLDQPEQELRLERLQADETGGWHLRFSQWYRGLPVWPASITLHLDRAGNVTHFDGAYIPTPRGIEVTPMMAAEVAVERARSGIPGGTRGEVDDPALVIHAPISSEPRLAWRFVINVGLVHSWQFLVDAVNGRILERFNRVLHANVGGSGIDLGGQSRSLNVWQAGSSYLLIDTSKPMYRTGTDPLQQPQGVITILDGRMQSASEILRADRIDYIVSNNPNQWPNPDGVSAAYHFSRTYDYFMNVLGRNSFDGFGANITAITRVGNYDNASWHGNLRIMLFGDVQPYAHALDVVAHELTHGITENSSGLIYANQPGALNESFSDIFGEMTEAFVEGEPDWKLGTRLNRIFRDFRDPGSLMIGGLNRPYPSRMSEFVELPNTPDGDNGGVHINSSILNHAFWLLAEGLPGAIGRNDAARIFFRCLTQHLQPQSQFIDARLGCLAAAEALYGGNSVQFQRVGEAFDQVEIFATPETPKPPPVPVVQAPDSTMFVGVNPLLGTLILLRREAAQGDGAGGTFFSGGVTLSRPAVSGDGTITLFINNFFDICLSTTADPSTQGCLGLDGMVHSVAISPNGALGAFVFRDPVTGSADNRISLIDLASGEAQSFVLLSPATDGVPVDAVFHADSMTFSTDSQVLYYDAISRVRFGNGPFAERWSIYALHLATGAISIVVPPIEGFDTGNPSMGRAGNRYMVFDARNVSNGNTSVVVLDLFTGQASEVGGVQGGLGYPSFTGDESAVIYAQRDFSAFFTGFSLVLQPLSADRLSQSTAPTWWLQDALLGVNYRRGQFVGTNQPPTIQLSSPQSNQTIEPGSVVQLQASATDADGAVARVEFYLGNESIGEDLSAPYEMSWTVSRPGSHRFTARAVDLLGAASDSSSIELTVRGEGEPGNNPRMNISRLPGGGMRLVIRGPAGNYIIAQSNDLVQWSDIYPVSVGASGEAVVEDPGGPANSSTLFYRARRE